jgi:PAS domain S-box-containing protein
MALSALRDALDVELAYRHHGPRLRLVGGTDVVLAAVEAQRRRRMPVSAGPAHPRAASALVDADYTRLFDAAPHPYLVLSRDLIILDANQAYLAATMTTRESLAGRRMFDAFPDDPSDRSADGVARLAASFARVLASGGADEMAVQRYPVRRPDGTFEERWWKPRNTPVTRDGGELAFILHHVEDVTAAAHGAGVPASDRWR